MLDLRGLPGAVRVQEGLDDLACGRRTAAASWVAVAASRLRALGLPIPPACDIPPNPELSLYELLRTQPRIDPYVRYNAMLSELDSFASALEARVRHAAAGP